MGFSVLPVLSPADGPRTSAGQKGFGESVMSRFKTAIIAGAALACTSMGASADTLTFQGLDFTLTALTSTDLQVKIAAHTGNSIATSASGDWAGIHFLDAFAVKPASGDVTATVAGWTFHDGGLAAGGCNGAGAGFVCFDRASDFAIPATGAMVFDVLFNGAVTFGATELKVVFSATDGGNKVGSLLSQPVTVGVPVPGPLVGAGLPGLAFAAGLLGWLRRKRETKSA
jgi:hypothetical protein